MQDDDISAGKVATDVTALLTRSRCHLEASVVAFETVHDAANLALLHSNIGRLMRLCAHMHAKIPSRERHFYDKAVSSYQKALQVLGVRKTYPPIWDTVTWDLSTTLYTVGTLLQDFPTAGHKVIFSIVPLMSDTRINVKYIYMHKELPDLVTWRQIGYFGARFFNLAT